MLGAKHAPCQSVCVMQIDSADISASIESNRSTSRDMPAA